MKRSFLSTWFLMEWNFKLELLLCVIATGSSNEPETNGSFYWFDFLGIFFGIIEKSSSNKFSFSWTE